MRIRKYTAKDRAAVEKIHFETGFLGKSMASLIDNRTMWNKNIAYYLQDVPESCFVAVEKGRVVGYLLGCLDDSKYDEVGSAIKTMFPTLARIPFMSRKDRRYVLDRFGFMIKCLTTRSDVAKFKMPKEAGHLHINLLKPARGKGTGTKLLRSFFRYAKSKGVKRIHADSFETRLNQNTNFWIKNGFKVYFKTQTRMWSPQYPKEEIYMVCYVKDL